MLRHPKMNAPHTEVCVQNRIYAPRPFALRAPVGHLLTLPKQHVAHGSVNIVVNRVAAVDHQAIDKLHGLSPLSSELPRHHDLAAFGPTLHDEPQHTIAGPLGEGKIDVHLCYHQTQDHPTQSHLKKNKTVLASAAQLVGHHPTSQRVAGSIPSQGTCLGCGARSPFGAQMGAQPTDISLPLFSLHCFQCRGVQPAAQDGYECGPTQNRKFTLKPFPPYSSVFVSVCVFNVWPRDTKRSDTAALAPSLVPIPSQVNWKCGELGVVMLGISIF